MLVFSFDHSINGHSSHNAVNVPTPIILWGIFIAFAIWLVQFCIKTTGSVPAPAGVTPQEPVKGKHDIRKYIKWVMLGNILFLVVFYSAICLFIYATRYYHYVVQGEYWPGLVIVGGIIIALGATALQLLFGLIAIAKPVSRRRGTLAILTTPLYAFASAIPFLAMMGGGWGRPLRVKGQQVHPELREGSDWTQGPKPDASELDKDTRAALEALWLHDAQKEHASVPAFSRITWMLAAIGAPADLMEWAYRCGLEEIEHTRICFALAAGYGGRSHSVKPMPDLLLCGLDMEGDPVVTLATESLKDGCQLEEFNADVAFACEAVCKEPATRFVLEQIAREERGHAAFSWAVLEYLYERNPEKVRPAIETSLREIDSYRRPTAFSWEKKRLVEKADPELMLKHGRLPDEEWAKMWDARLIQTKTRLQAMLNEKRAA